MTDNDNTGGQPELGDLEKMPPAEAAAYILRDIMDAYAAVKRARELGCLDELLLASIDEWDAARFRRNELHRVAGRDFGD